MRHVGEALYSLKKLSSLKLDFSGNESEFSI